ncbi:endonuclease 8-like 2 isoform X1 [Python bivittatus]|uniref:Endonuclease 8-like 2 n=2 Tax=Python bivittatus TaxID=176946 RepID=A0A9F5ISK1_PYTBI|nr:endonuclease 8-like 2 isoform X1 [Python bivittatus]XP_025022901.1 endonuclease 8-like 2 isoform X1 [Python bivittatus]
MPEGPSVKKFQLLCSPFVGQVVSRVGGSTRQINPDDLKTLTLWDTQVHGKNLFLAFGTKEELMPSQDSIPLDLSEHRSASQRLAMPGSSSFLQGLKENEAEICSPQCYQQEELASWLASDMDNNNGHTWKWLRFHFGLFGSIRADEFARANKANKKGDWKDPIPRLVLHFDAGGFLVFYNCRIQQCSSPTTEPATDILSLEFDRERALEVLAKDIPVCYVLLNQSYFSGIGNVIKNEALYLARIHPLSLGSSLESSDLKSLLDHAVQFSLAWLHNKLQRQRLQLQIYMKDKCPKGHEVRKATFGPPDGLKRLTWWCPQCQPRVPPEEMDMPLAQGT